MTEPDMRRLESAVGRAFPPAVRAFFLNFPPALREVESDPDDDDFQLTDDVDDLIRMNTPGGWCIAIASRSGRVSPQAGSNVFALGSGGCGETWWVDLDDERGAVYFCDAGTYAEDSDRVAASIAEFASRFLGPEE